MRLGVEIDRVSLVLHMPIDAGRPALPMVWHRRFAGSCRPLAMRANASGRRGGVILRCMGSPDRRRRSRSGRLLDSLVWGAALGGAAGAVLGTAIDGVGAGAGALIGVLLYAPAEAVTSLSRGAGAVKPLWQRIFSSALLMALFGWLLGLIYGPDGLLLTAIISGALLGLLGLRPGKAALGLVIGAALGALLQVLDAGLESALVAAA